jgi:type IX secretion system PorP/SprF family membrane protein
MKLRIVIVWILFLGMADVAFAQQDAQYTQYMYNTISINPAYAGNRGVLSLTALHRDQWVGLDGAPKSQTFNIHAPVGNNVGLGFNVINDAIGPMQETSFDIAFSYTVPTSLNGKLSFGLKAGGHLLNIDYMGLRQFVPELTAADNIDQKFSPNFGAGMYYHSERFYAGLSVPNILETRHFDEASDTNDASSFVSKERASYYLMTGYILDLAPNLQFKPAVLGKIVNGSPFQLDVSANFLFANKVTLGGAYRWNNAWSALAAFQLSRGVMIGMAYDAETTDLGQASFNKGSFEVLLRFEIFNTANPMRYPRFF